MSSGHFAAYAAVSISVLSICSCVFFIPLLLGKIADIQASLRLDMEEFEIASNDAWRQMQSARRGASKSSASTSFFARNKRQAGQCQCDGQNTCPAGPPGSPGAPGSDGEPGKDGLAGEQGLPGVVPPVHTTPDGRCRVCPNGPRGLPGPTGTPGGAGNKGEPGLPGRPGQDGQPGSLGSPGSIGDAGASGKNGEPGQAGSPGSRGSKGEAGEPGRDGAPGEKGPSGQPGRNGIAGPPGQAGPVGPPGPAGSNAEPGADGFPGGQGPPGEDAQYCPCPRRSAFAALKEGSEESGSLVEKVAAKAVEGAELSLPDSSASAASEEEVDYAEVPAEDRIKIGDKAVVAEKLPTSTQSTPSTQEPWYKPVISYVTRILSPDEVALRRRTTEAPDSQSEAEEEESLTTKEAAETSTAPLLVFPAEEEEVLEPSLPEEDNSDEFDVAREAILHRRFPDSFGNEKDAPFKLKKN